MASLDHPSVCVVGPTLGGGKVLPPVTLLRAANNSSSHLHLSYRFVVRAIQKQLLIIAFILLFVPLVDISE